MNVGTIKSRQPKRQKSLKLVQSRQSREMSGHVHISSSRLLLQQWKTYSAHNYSLLISSTISNFTENNVLSEHESSLIGIQYLSYKETTHILQNNA